MIKAIYGLKDAPRAWRLRLNQILLEAGLSQLKTEQELYVSHCTLHSSKMWNNEKGTSRTEPLRGDRAETQLQIALTMHVDDLKGIATEKAMKHTIDIMEKAVGKVTILKDNFEHCGIKHETSEKAITMHQNHYVAQLRPINEGLLGEHKDDEDVNGFSPELGTLFMSLLGGLAWLVLTRLDICIYVQAMQRHAQAPRVSDVRKLNRLLRWVQRRPAGIVFHRHKGKMRISAVSDSAFRSLEDNTTGLALRGFVVLLTVISESHPGGKCLILDYGTKKHKRVNRSTFAAELNAAVDTLDVAKIVQLTLEEILNPSSMETIAKAANDGQLLLPLELCIDAKAVYDALAKAEFSMPSEATLIPHLHSVRDDLAMKRITKLWWIDTRDMVADGLNKGGLPRDPILTMCEEGHWTLREAAIAFSK
jgi:hypothetical protein